MILINILVFLKYLTWWITNWVVKTWIFVCQIIHFCTSFIYGRSESFIYERKKTFFLKRYNKKKFFWGGFRTITSNPSDLQEYLISRRAVGINGFCRIFSKKWKCPFKYDFWRSGPLNLDFHENVPLRSKKVKMSL